MKINNTEIEKIENFKYLGFTIGANKIAKKIGNKIKYLKR